MKLNRWRVLVGVLVLALGGHTVANSMGQGATKENQLGSTAVMVAPDERHVVNLNTLHMGTVISIKVYGKTSEDANRFAQLADDLAGKYDDLLTVHRESPLNEVNQHAGEKVAVTPEIADLVSRSLAVAKLTDGAFEPTIGALVNVWKIGFGGEHVPPKEQIAKALKSVDYRLVEQGKLDDGRDYVKLAPGQNMDLGGSAKGFIGTKMQEALKAAGLNRGILSLGGNVVAIGERPDETPWRIGLQHPDEERNAYFGYVNAKDESVITSGAYERYFEENGRRYGHILSAKTGQPVRTDVTSVSIVSRDGTQADALCTAFFAMGWDKSIAFLKTHPHIKAVLLNADMTHVAVTPAAKMIFVLTDKKMQMVEIQP